jgi:hypothetical protein
MGFFTLTDHETLSGIDTLHHQLQAEYGGAPPIPVIPGIEMTIRDPRIGHTIHVNVLGLNQGQMLELARQRGNVDRFLEFCRCQDLFHAYNHPFWFEAGERGTIEAVEALIPEFPLIEINAGRISQLNDRTLDLARRNGKNVIATSDSHTGNVGRAYTMAPGASVQEFLRHLLAGVSLSVPRHACFREFAAEVIETIELVFLSSSAFKLKETVLRGMPFPRWIAHTALSSDFVMKPSLLKAASCKVLQLLAYPPAYAFVRRQSRIHNSLGEAEA